MSTLIAYGVITGLLLTVSGIIHLSKSANRQLPGCLSWEKPVYGRHAVAQPRRQPERRHRLPYAVRHPWRYLVLLRWARQERSWARDAAAFARPDGTASATRPAGAVPLDIRATSSDGFPAVAFRAAEP